MASIRKHLVNAFTKIAKERWTDSKRTPHVITRYGFNSPREWGRHMAAQYFGGDDLYEVNSAIVEMLEDAAKMDVPVIQADYDALAEEEISCW